MAESTRRRFFARASATAAGSLVGARNSRAKSNELPPVRTITHGPAHHWFGYCDKLCSRSVIASLFLALVLFAAVGGQATESGEVTIRADFPGGNVTVLHADGDSVQVAPDLRGDNPWFYWCFEAKASKPGRVEFVFPKKVAGFTDGAIGYQGPAISTDRGKTWNWMGTENVDGNSFVYDFVKAKDRVRFAVTIPYLQSDFDKFVEQNASNPHLKTSVLTKSRNGRDVELLQVGKPGPNVMAVLMTGRHHAAETMASYVLEGLLQEAISDSPAGEEFRKKYVLYAVPFVDKDGVEEGDQGKNRKPHDHNRDYNETSIYPEVQAIKELDKAKKFQFALDFHCPTLVMKDHQVMYFSGAKQHPRHNFENVSEFAGCIKKRLPENAPYGPLVWLRDETKFSPKNSRYFGFKDHSIMAVTFEFPFAPPAKATDPASCRRYGQVMLQAWVDTQFRVAN